MVCPTSASYQADQAKACAKRDFHDQPQVNSLPNKNKHLAEIHQESEKT